jgi:hypothetical protein
VTAKHSFGASTVAATVVGLDAIRCNPNIAD